MSKPLHNYGHDKLHWEGMKLYFSEKLLVELVPHEVHAKHWHLKFCWRDEKTPEFFNIYNARHNSRIISLYHLNYDVWELPQVASLVR